MSDNKSNFLREYKRASKSPWDQDKSTVLLLADARVDDAGNIELEYTRYIYLHRDNVGRSLGISISKTLLNDNPDFEYRYIEGIEMIGFLLMHIEEVVKFTSIFSDEFETVFLLDPVSFFEAAELRWYNLLEQV